MSPSIASLIILVLSNVLPLIGINLGNADLTTFVQVLVTLIAGVVIWVRHISLKKEALGTRNVNAFGGVKK